MVTINRKTAYQLGKTAKEDGDGADKNPFSKVFDYCLWEEWFRGWAEGKTKKGY